MAILNVVKNYDWTSSPRGSGLRENAPRVNLKSYKIVKSQLVNRFLGYINAVNLDTEDYYNKLYSEITEAEDVFILPYFGDNVRSFSNSFGDTFQNGFGGGGGIGETLDATLQGLVGASAQVASVVGTESIGTATSQFADGNVAGGVKTLKDAIGKGGNPGSYIETPKFYQYEPNDAPLEVSFVLSNTVNDDFSKNYDLVKKLTEINRPFRKNSIAMDPPRIFEVKLNGHRYMRWAYCSSFNVNLIGTKRLVDDIVTPEAYQINMSLQSLTVEAANFLEKV